VICGPAAFLAAGMIGEAIMVPGCGMAARKLTMLCAKWATCRREKASR
jgi:hypothetical protein